ncbi:MAG: hypothetical protein PHI27_09590 [Eubacteriales bacterium]|nr:hypothetical protein [Eubacteriales bacterium]MDD3882494.1 hypothetical protein [Eubacteriales bacterium]MDD4512794.1 hypothetical protein [Eubacteriales bacterium]
MGGRGGHIGKQKKGTPRNNQAQNRQTNSIKAALKMTKDSGQGFHHDITGKHMSYQEITEEAKSYNEYRKGKRWTRANKKR